MKIILASTSPYRRKLLDQLNIQFTVVAPQVDEEDLKKKSPVSTSDLPLYLAQKKAESLLTLYPESLIIGCDQMALLNDVKLDKPGTREKAIAQLKKLQGRTHQLITAVALIYQGQRDLITDITELTMKPLSDQQIQKYVDLENPLNCAGSYKVESLGIALFEKIKTNDASAIVGLPLMAVAQSLEKFNFPVI